MHDRNRGEIDIGSEIQGKSILGPQRVHVQIIRDFPQTTVSSIAR